MSDNTSLAFEAVQAAAFTVLNGNIGCALYDAVPEKPTYPYARFADVNDGENEARGVRGRTVVLRIEVLSRDAGGKFECYGIINKIVEKMTAGKLAMTGWKEVYKVARAGQVKESGEAPEMTYGGTATFMISVVRAS